MAKKASDYFKVVSLEGHKLTLEITLEAPTTDNLSSKGNSNIIGRAFGKLPFHVGGKQMKINAFVMLPTDSNKAVEEVEL